MRLGQMGGDVNWIMKQFIEELKKTNGASSHT